MFEFGMVTARKRTHVFTVIKIIGKSVNLVQHFLNKANMATTYFTRIFDHIIRLCFNRAFPIKVYQHDVS